MGIRQSASITPIAPVKPVTNPTFEKLTINDNTANMNYGLLTNTDKTKLLENKLHLEQYLANEDNNKTLTSIRNTLDNYKSTDFLPKSNILISTPEEQQAIESSWDVGKALSKSYKLINSSQQSLQKAKYARQEKKTLENAILNDKILKKSLKKQDEIPYLHSKERLSEINNDAFRQKQLTVTRLMYIIYFILYSIGLGLAMASGFITLRILTIGFIIGLLYLIYSILVSKSFWKEYGDTSMGVAKGTVKDAITTVGPIKKCPKRCVVKK